MSTVYLDYNATTPLDPRVLEAMLPYLRGEYGNASSRHAVGRRAAVAVDRAREQVAEALGADPREIVFTSGATESNNLALKGIARWPSTARRGRHVVTAATEHRAVLDPCRALEEEGWEVTRLGVDAEGMIDLDELEATLREDTVLVSLMHANNETGVLHPVERIGELCRERGVLFHTDATQSFGKEPLDLGRMPIDALSLSAHKIYGAKGVGALYLRRRRPRVRCESLIDGGGHERGVRSGTLNVPGIVSLGEAAALAMRERQEEARRVCRLRDALQRRLMATVDGLRLNGHPDRRLANTANLGLAGLDAATLVETLDGVAVSSAAACSAATMQPSYVLGAMGLSDDEMRGSIRISLGRFTREAEIGPAHDALVAGIARLRETASA